MKQIALALLLAACACGWTPGTCEEEAQRLRLRYSGAKPSSRWTRSGKIFLQPLGSTSVLLDGEATCRPLREAEEKCDDAGCAWFSESCEPPAWYSPNTLRCNVCYSDRPSRHAGPGSGFRECSLVVFEKKAGAWTYKFLHRTSIT